MLASAIAFMALEGQARTSGTQLLVQPSAQLPTHFPIQMAVTIGGSGFCGHHGYVNALCTSITLCQPGTQICQEIDGILVDSGSVGLRIFDTVLQFPLPLLSIQSDTDRVAVLAENAPFRAERAWGPIALATVRFSERKIDQTTLPIQIMSTTATQPERAGFQGILGLGVFREDCGGGCAIQKNNGIYFACPDSQANVRDCESARVAPEKQVRHPVVGLERNHNGISIALPQIFGPSDSVTGTLTLGIDNSDKLKETQVIPVDSLGGFRMTFAGRGYDGSQIDSGSNAVFFPGSPEIPRCAWSARWLATLGEFFCPKSPMEFFGVIPNLLLAHAPATNHSSGAKITWTAVDGQERLARNSLVAPSLAGFELNQILLGIPFFFGKQIYFGIEGEISVLGSGPLLGVRSTEIPRPPPQAFKNNREQ